METDSKQDTVPQEDLQEKYTEELEEERKLKKWDLVNKQWAATAIFSGVVLLLVAFLFIRHEIFTGFLSYVLGVLRPITIGLVIAFVLYRPTCQIEKLLQKAQKKFPRFPAGVIAVFCSYFLMLLLLGGVIWIIVPQFADSIRDFSDNILIYYSNVMKFLNSDRGEQIFRFLQENGFDPASLRTKLTSLTSYIPDALGTLGTLASGLIGGFIDFFIGLIFSVYVLAGKNKLRRQGKRILQHFLPKKHYQRLSHYGRLTFNTFSNFVSGQLTEAVIIGVLCFFGMLILRIPYAGAVSAFVAVTALVPIFGAWLGGGLGTFLILLADPIKAVWFVLYLLILQQVEGNLIYPKVVGKSVGLPGLLVLVAVTIGGGAFGVLGMLFSVPVCAVLYNLYLEFMQKSDPQS